MPLPYCINEKDQPHKQKEKGNHQKDKEMEKGKEMDLPGYTKPDAN